MGLINHELAFDLEDLRKLSEKTENVCKELSAHRKDLIVGLEQLRKEWNTPAGRYFFDELDNNWEADVQKFEDTLKVFKAVLDDAISEFEQVVEKAERIKIDLP